MDGISSELAPDIINIHELNSTYFVKQEIEDWFSSVKKEKIEDSGPEDCSNEFVEDSQNIMEQLVDETGEIYPGDDFSKHWGGSFVNSVGRNDVDNEDIEHIEQEELPTTMEKIPIPELHKNDIECRKNSSATNYYGQELVNVKRDINVFDGTNKTEKETNVGPLNNKGSENYKCQFCDFNCSRKYTITRHMDCIHLKLKKFKCDLCTFQTAHKATLKIHIASIHLNLKNYKCIFCDFDSSTKAKLKRHIDAIHLNLKKFKCSLCEFRSAAKYKLKMHIDSVHLKLKTHKCNFCDFTCSTQSDLKKHVDGVHLKLKNFQCEICDFNTFRKDTLSTHVSAVHLKLKKYKCDMCSSSFAKKHNLKMHYKCCPLSKERT